MSAALSLLCAGPVSAAFFYSFFGVEELEVEADAVS